MSDGTNDKRLTVASVDETVRESGQESTAQSQSELSAGFRVSPDAADHAVNFVQKLPAQPGALLFVPVVRIVQLLSGERQKSDCHRPRYLDMTSA